MKLPLLLACLAAALTACDDGPHPPRDLPPPPDTAPAALAPSPPPSAPADAADAGAGDAGADASGPSVALLAGTWEGTYDAKKGRLDMPKGVADTARAADDGKAATGAGTVKLTILPDGSVDGRSDGALGAASVRGKLDSKMLRCSFVADDMASQNAMMGVLIGLVKEGSIAAEVRVSSGNAVLVREAKIDLKKKP